MFAQERGVKMELTKEKRIYKKLRKYKNTYKTLPPEKMIIALPLIKSASFMEVELEDLEKIIAQEGASDDYQNGANQKGRKISANLQAYNSLVKSYNMVNTRLEAMLPKIEKKNTKLEALMNE